MDVGRISIIDGHPVALIELSKYLATKQMKNKSHSF